MLIRSVKPRDLHETQLAEEYPESDTASAAFLSFHLIQLNLATGLYPFHSSSFPLWP